mgnify:CR=1 FL=1
MRKGIHGLAMLIEENTEKFNLHDIYLDIHNFCTVDLSAFYFDIRKDTLYCDPEDSKKRKSTLLLLNIILDASTEIMEKSFACSLEN